jgi:H/ACA ribonucleoprotein complex subunit 4
MKKDIKELLEFGIINIDKSSGPTSFDVSHFVNKKLGLRKTSHFGTLDPKVTGVLPVALNRACKLTGHFMGHDKVYIGIMRIHEDKDMKEIQKIINKEFTGKIQQLPPVKSRVKRALREREVKKFKLLEQNGKNILFEADVQAGTYIRKLISDLGDQIGGAHMLELRRTRAGIFEEKKSFNLYDFEKAVDEYKKGNEKLLLNMITPGEIINKIYPSMELKKASLDNILTGKPIHKEDLSKKYKFEKEEIVCVFNKDRFVGIYEIINSKDIFAKPKFVMQPIK